MSFETDAERQNYIAVARRHADAAVEITSHHARATLGQASSQVERVIATSNINVSQISATGAVEAQSIAYQSVAQSNVLGAEAYHQGEVSRIGANQQIAVIDRDAANDVAVISASAEAGYRSDIGVANVRSQEIATLSSIDVSRISRETDIRISVIEAEIASSRDSEVEVARVRASGILSEAAIRVNQYQQDSLSSAGATIDIARYQETEASAIAAIRAKQIADSDSWEIADISGEASNVAGTSRSIGRSQVAEISESSRNQIRRGQAITSISAKYETDQASSDASTKRYSADASHAASEFQADIQSMEDRFSVNTQSESSKYKADLELLSDRFGADRGFQQQQKEADNEASARVSTANTKSTDSKYESDVSYNSVVLRENRENGRLLKKLGYADRRFWEAWRVVGELGESGHDEPAGFRHEIPFVSVGATLTPSQIQMQMNSAHASAVVESRSRWLDDRDEASGRGIAGSSPFMIGLRIAMDSRALAEAQAKSAESYVSLSSLNADAILQAQALRSDVFTSQQSAYIAVESNNIQRQVGIVGSALRMVGSVA